MSNRSGSARRRKEPFDCTVVGQKFRQEIVREQKMLPPVAKDQLIAEEFAADDKEHGNQVLAKAESKNEQQAWNKDRIQHLR